MFGRKTAALCILALLMTTITPAAKADINGQCDPYSAALPVVVAVIWVARITWKVANTPAGGAAIGGIVGWGLNELTDDDEDDSVPEHSHDVPQHDHTVPLHTHSDDDEESTKGENPDDGETPEGSNQPEGGGGTDQSYGGGYGSCPSNPYTF